MNQLLKINLSKTQYIKGLYCNRRLWLYKNARMKEEFDDSAQAIMDKGTSIGEMAQSLYPEGILIDEQYNQIKEGEEHTKKEIQKGAKTIFEATAITPDGCYSRIDILNRVGKDDWDLIEVKSSSEVKDYYYDDTAFQRYVFESAGYKVRKSILLHINKEYIKNGPMDPKQLLIEEDITEAVSVRIDGVKNNIKALNTMLSKKENTPNRLLTPKACGNPFPCGYNEYCWKDIPEYSLLNVLSNRRGRSSELRDALYRAGKYTIDQLPVGFELSQKEIIDLTSYREDKTIVDKDSIREFLDSLEYPLYYFDYETINTAVPTYDGTHPFQVIPFQFSLHIQQKDRTLKHVEFLHEDRTDPRKPLIECLIKNIGKTGTILAHHSSYEKMVNSSLAEAFPEYEKEINVINERLVDSKIPFSNRWIYNHKTLSSGSLKSLLPVYCPDLSYSVLEIQEGGTASNEYLRTISTQTREEERKKIFRALREYCGLDTMAMVRLIDYLHEVSK